MSRGLFIQDLGAWMFQRLSLVSTKEMRVFVMRYLSHVSRRLPRGLNKLDVNQKYLIQKNIPGPLITKLNRY